MQEHYQKKHQLTNTNRYGGVIYGAKFLISRIGFLRSVKRVLLICDTSLVIVDPNYEGSREEVLYSSIANFTIGSSAKEFVIQTSKSKETYNCNERRALLTVFQEMYERFQYEKDGHPNPTIRKDTVEELCWKRSTPGNLVYVRRRISISASCINSLDLTTGDILSSIPLIEIVKIQKIASTSASLLLYFEGSRIRKYKCSEREPMVQAIKNNLKMLHNADVIEEFVQDEGPLHATLKTNEIIVPVLMEIPALKISKKIPMGSSHFSEEKATHRLLGLTQLAIVERDAITRKTIRQYPFSEIFNIVLFGDREVKKMGTNIQSNNEVGNSWCEGALGIELKNGQTKRFLCKSCHISDRDDELGIGLSSIRKSDYAKLFQEITNTKMLPSRLQEAGSIRVFTAKAAKELFVATMLSQARLNGLLLPWSLSETPVGCKEGSWKTAHNPEYAELLLKKVATLDASTNPDKMELVLQEFNTNFGICFQNLRDRKSFAAVMKLIEGNLSLDILTLALLCIHRLLCIRGPFEDIQYMQFKNAVDAIITTTGVADSNAAFAAAQALECMVVNMVDSKSPKTEIVNRKLLFADENALTIVSAALRPEQYVKISNPEAMDVSTVQNYESILNMFSGTHEHYLSSCTLLHMLENVLFTRKKGSSEKTISTILGAMSINRFSYRHALFQLCRLPSLPIVKSASMLLKVHVLEQETAIVECLQNYARDEGILIWQLYLALFSCSKSQRRNSSQLVALLTHSNSLSSSVIRKTFPEALINDSDHTELVYDEDGNAIFEGIEGNPFGTRHQVSSNAKFVILLPDFFERVRGIHAERSLLWNGNAVAELKCRLLHELADLDVQRIRHYFFLVSDPLRIFQECRIEDDDSSRDVADIQVKDSTYSGNESACNDEPNPDETESSTEPTEIEAVPTEFLLCWNHEEFEMHYKCFEDEVRVGSFYLANILSDHGHLTTKIENPAEFLTLLYFRLLKEKDQGIRLLCLKVMCQLFNQEKKRMRSFLFLNSLLQASASKDDVAKAPIKSIDNEIPGNNITACNELLHSWPLVVRSNVLLLVYYFFSNAANIQRFLLESERNLSIIFELVLEVAVNISSENEIFEGKEIVLFDDQNSDENLAESNSDMEENNDGQSDASIDSDEFCAYSTTKQMISVESSTAASATGIVTICIAVLAKAVRCNDGGIGSLPNYSPLSNSNRIISSNGKYLGIIIRLLGCGNSSIYANCLSLLQQLIHNNDSIVPNLYKTGIFYFLLRFGGSTIENMRETATLIEKLHLRQKLAIKIPAKYTNGADPLMKLCFQSILVNVLPISLIAQLLRHGATAFAATLLGNSNNPEVIWNQNMRQDLMDSLDSFMKANKVFVSFDKESIEKTEEMQLPLMEWITYPAEVNALQCYQYYLENLLDEESFPDWYIADEAAFLQALVDAIRRWLEGDKFENNMSISDCILVLRSIALVLRRSNLNSNAEIATLCTLQSFTLFSTILQVLSWSLSRFMERGDVENKHLTYTSLEILSLASVISKSLEAATNVESAINNLLNDMEVLASAKPLQEWHYSAMQLLLSTLTNLVRTRKGCVAMANLDTGQRIRCLAKFLAVLEGDGEVKIEVASKVLDIVHAISNTNIAAAMPNNALVLKSGLIWKLFLLLLVYRKKVSKPVDIALNVVAIKSCDILLAYIQSKVDDPSIDSIRHCIKVVMTIPLKELLVSNGSEHVLSIMEGEIREPTVVWTYSMRKELIQLASDSFTSSSTETPPNFMYTFVKEELHIGGVFVHFFNDCPQRMHGIDVKIFFEALIATLRKDIDGIRRDCNALHGITIRLGPVVEALYNLVKGVDEACNILLQSEVISTLYFMLDKIFADTTAIQLFAIQCLHIATYHDKCCTKIGKEVEKDGKLMWYHLPNLSLDESDTRHQIGATALQIVGKLCTKADSLVIVSACIEASAVENVFELVQPSNGVEVALPLLCMILSTIVQRYTPHSKSFCNDLSRSRFVKIALQLLQEKDLMHASKLYTANFLNAFKSNPGSGNRVDSMLKASRIWEDFRPTDQNVSSKQLEKLLLSPLEKK